jgi:hypothetical protein
MLAQRTLLRTAQRLPSRTAPLRSTKRSYSTETGSGFKPQDNAFNRERDAVKAHAAQSSGNYSPFEPSQTCFGPAANRCCRFLAKTVPLVRSPHSRGPRWTWIGRVWQFLTTCAQCRDSCPCYWNGECVHFVERALGTRSSPSAARGETAILLPEYTEQAVSLGQWKQGGFINFGRTSRSYWRLFPAIIPRPQSPPVLVRGPATEALHIRLKCSIVV